jgi:hypothetical protein
MNKHLRNDNAEPGQGRHYRTDAGTLRKPHRTDEGFVVVEGVAAIPGVYPYRSTDGTIIRELIDADELAKADALMTLGRKPVTRRHPATGIVTPATVKEDQVGTVGENVIVGAGGFIQVTMTVHRADAIAEIDSGVKELSCGYFCRIDRTPGVWKDAAGVEHAYDQRQYDRRYNHIALMDRGRHGPAASIRVDGADTVAEQTTGDDPDTNQQQEPAMKFKIRIDGREYEVEASSAEEALRIQARIQAMMDAEKERDTLKGRVDGLEAELRTAKADAEKLRTDAAQPTPEQLQKRIALVLLAESVKVKREDAMAMDDITLKRTIAKQAYPDLKLDDATDGYLDGLLAAAQTAASKSKTAAAGTTVAPAFKRADNSDLSPLQQAIEQRNEAVHNAWKPTK